MQDQYSIESKQDPVLQIMPDLNLDCITEEDARTGSVRATDMNITRDNNQFDTYSAARDKNALSSLQ